MEQSEQQQDVAPLKRYLKRFIVLLTVIPTIALYIAAAALWHDPCDSRFFPLIGAFNGPLGKGFFTLLIPIILLTCCLFKVVFWKFVVSMLAAIFIGYFFFTISIPCCNVCPHEAMVTKPSTIN